jgi:hypothetical protein
MELWMSGEIQIDVADQYRHARRVVEHKINSCIGKKVYGTALIEWAYIAIIRAEDSEDYDEVTKYWKKRKVAEFRLKIDYDAFRNGTPRDHVRLLSESLMRSLDLMREIGVVDVDLETLRKDVKSCLARAAESIDQ